VPKLPKSKPAIVQAVQDPDPDGAKLAATGDPLGEAAKLVVGLQAAAPEALATSLLAAEVKCNTALRDSP
jgi:N-alpha-acetyltransferase 15/16, NatA auxiliary subunit